jgi:hypothetical protein
VNYPDGRFTVQFEGTPLPFRVFDKIQTVTPAAIVENKRLGAALAMVKEHQATYAPNRRRYGGPAAEQSGSAWHADEEPDAAGWLSHDRRTHGCSMMLGGGRGPQGLRCAHRPVGRKDTRSGAVRVGTYAEQTRQRTCEPRGA